MYETLLKTDPSSSVYQSDVATTLNNLGVLLSDMDRPEDAKNRSKRALEMRETLLKTDPSSSVYQSHVATTLNNLGTLLWDMGRPEDAKNRYERALEMREKLLDPDLVSKIFWGRGRCHESMGNLDQAYEDYNESIEQIELIRSQFSLEEYKLDILRGKAGAYSDMISLLCTKKNDPGKALEYVGRAKSRTLLEYLRFTDLPAPQSIPLDLLSHEKELLGSIKTLDWQARKAEKSDQVYKISQEIKEKQKELDKLYIQIEEYAPDYVDMRKGLPLPIEGITDLLNKQSKKTAFIEYYTTPEKVFIFVMRPNESKPNVRIQDLSSGQLWEYVNSYYSEVVLEPGKKQTWQELAEFLIAPVFDDIKCCEMLYLIPHGLLHYLPLHALSINGRHLIEHIPVVYAPSLTTIKYAQRKSGGKYDSYISLGFTPNENEKALFEGEAVMVSDRLRKGIISREKPVLGKDATREYLLKEAAGKDIIHLSCHAYFDPQTPLNSGLLLSDGMLTVKDIFGMDLDADLLVLSACETGLNEQKPGDELVGLTRAFLYAGARSIMVTLWSVSAASTLRLMESFYEKTIKQKMSEAEALQKAQIELMRLTAQDVIDYYGEAKNRLKGSDAPAAHRLLERTIADTRFYTARDFEQALKEYDQLRSGLAPDSDEYRELTKILSRCRMALRSPEPADYGIHIYAHPYFWAPFVLVGDWK